MLSIITVTTILFRMLLHAFRTNALDLNISDIEAVFCRHIFFPIIFKEEIINLTSFLADIMHMGLHNSIEMLDTILGEGNNLPFIGQILQIPVDRTL